jgi:PAS domain S-box-containing protein
MLTAEPSIILVVDDHPTNLKMLFSFLQESGFKVLVAKTGESALQKLKKIVPDLILLDVMMPGLDGFETCRRLKASAKTKDIPVIFMTALSESIDKIKGLTVGAVDYITKPFQQEEVLVRVENQIKIRKLQRQLETQNKQLQQSQALLESVLNVSLDGIVVYKAIRDNQNKIIDFKWILLNPSAEENLKNRAINLLGKRLLQEMPEVREMGLFEQYVTVVETGKALETELYYTYETLQFWVQLVAVRLNDGLAVTFRDISQRKRTEAALQNSEAELRGLFTAMRDLVLVFNAEGRYLKIFPTEPNLLYKPAQILLGKTLHEIFSPSQADQFLNCIRKTLETQKTQDLEYSLTIAETQKWFSAKVSPLSADSVIFVARDISARKYAEEALRQSQERLQLALDGSDLGLWDWNIRRKEAYLSPQWKRRLGYQVQEIENTYQSFEQLIHPQDLPRVRDAIANHFAGNSPTYEVEFRMRSKMGEWKWTLARAKLTERDESGNPVRMTGTHKDISDRKAVEIALQQSQARLQKLAANIPGMLYEFVRQADGAYGFAYVSSGCRDIMEWEPEEILHDINLCFEQIHPEDIRRIYHSIETSARTLEPWVWQGRMITPSGKVKWVQGGARPERHANGDILWHGLLVDVSDRKQVEIELETAKAALERQIQRVLLQERITQEIRSSLRPQQIFQTAADQIGQAFGANRCLIHTYIEYPIPQIPFVAQYEQSSTGTISYPEIPVVGNPHAQLVLAQDQAVASDNVYTDPLLEPAIHLCQQIGLKSMVAVRTSYHQKPNGLIALHQYDFFRHWTPEEIETLEAVAAQVGIAIAQANLLEQEKQQRQELARQNHALEKAKLEAEAANRAKSQFLSKMSHELRTPLNAILGFTQVMAHDEALTTEHQDYLGIINRSGEHLLDLINDILSMSKIEAGQITLNEHRFDLYQLLDSMEEMLRFKASSKGLELIFERAPDIPQYIQTDESKLRQVLINLLGNAIKFTQIGYVRLHVCLATEDWYTGDNQEHFSHLDSQTLIFEIEDTGLGIASDELGSLFDPFVQTQTGRRSMEGTGLGLPISQQFVRMLGGDISVRSTLGRGSTFTFDIRVNVVDQADEKPISHCQRVLSLEPNQPSYRILVVEDAAVNRKLLVKILESVGFEVRTAANGQEGIALWESWSPHLIWMDVVMPVMDGCEAAQRIKQTPQGQDTVIIALTASAFEEQRAAVISAGCDDFISKPFQREELLGKMAQHLGVRYIYEQPQPMATRPSSTRHQPLTPEALRVMPASWVFNLHQAALYADDELMHELIEQIPAEHNGLRQALRDLLDNFLIEQIINLTEPASS